MSGAAEHLAMTEDYGEGNLVEQAGSFMSETVLVDWNAVTVRALGTCDSTVLPAIEDLLIVQRCIDALADKACADPRLFRWPNSVI